MDVWSGVINEPLYVLIVYKIVQNICLIYSIYTINAKPSSLLDTFLRNLVPRFPMFSGLWWRDGTLMNDILTHVQFSKHCANTTEKKLKLHQKCYIVKHQS